MFYVIVCRDGILAPSFLSHKTSPAAVALVNYRIVIKPCVVCSCIVCRCLSCCCSYLYVVVVAATLAVGFCSMMYVIFAPLYVGFMGFIV
jgi:hypothetical protein